MVQSFHRRPKRDIHINKGVLTSEGICSTKVDAVLIGFMAESVDTY